MINPDTCKLVLKILEQMKTELTNIEKILKEETSNQETKPINPLQLTSIFESKTAIIGNYDSFGSNQLKLILESFGMNAEIFKTGSEILEKIKNGYNCDVIFTNNIYQRGISGPELLKQLRQLQNFNTPIIIHTIDKNARFHYVDNLGFDEYISKPIFTIDNEKILEVKTILEKFIK